MELSRLWEKDELSILVGLDPPKGTDATAFARNAQRCKGRVDAVIVNDASDAIMRMSPLGACWILAQQGIRPVLGQNGRDRNRLAIQGDLLTAWNMGIRDVVVEDGKDPSYGDHPLTRPVRDVSELEMIAMIGGMNEGRDLGGSDLKGGTGFFLGSTAEWLDTPDQIESEFAKKEKLAAAGAEVFVVSPQFDIPRAKELVQRAKGLGPAVFVSIMLLKSVGMARYLNEVPGVSRVPDDVIQKMADAPVKAKAGVQIAAEAIEELKGVADGVILIPLGWEHKLPDVLEAIGR